MITAIGHPMIYEQGISIIGAAFFIEILDLEEQKGVLSKDYTTEFSGLYKISGATANDESFNNDDLIETFDRYFIQIDKGSDTFYLIEKSVVNNINKL